MISPPKLRLLLGADSQSKLEIRVVPRTGKHELLHELCEDQVTKRVFVDEASKRLLEMGAFRERMPARAAVEASLCRSIADRIGFEKGKRRASTLYALYLVDTFRQSGTAVLRSELQCPLFGFYASKDLCKRHWDLQLEIGAASPELITAAAKRDIEARLRPLLDKAIEYVTPKLAAYGVSRKIGCMLIGDILRQSRAIPAEHVLFKRIDVALARVGRKLTQKLASRFPELVGDTALPMTVDLLERIVAALKRLKLRTPIDKVREVLTALWAGIKIQTIAEHFGLDPKTIHEWFERAGRAE